MTVDAVLGLSMTPTSVGLVLVEGQDADGATMDRDAFTVDHGAGQTSEQATAAVLRTEAVAATRGLRMHSIGVTWSEDADAEASRLMQSLSDSGFDNVVAIRMPEATEALARGVADVLGYATTAVCVIEPDLVISLIVNTSDGAIQTALNHAIDSDEALTSWLSTVFTRADWAPEALVLVGSAGDFEPLLPRLEEVLSVPVFAPEEAKLALARGAALASAQGAERPLDVFGEVGPRINSSRTRTGAQAPRQRSALVRRGPAALLVAGVVTFVVSVSIAISLQLSPARDSGPTQPAPAANAQAPAARPSPPAMPPPPLVAPPAPQQALPAPEAPPAPTEVPAATPDVPEQAPVYQVPAADPNTAPQPDAPAVDPAPSAAPPMVGTPLPPSYTAPAPAVPTKKPGILTRIKERLIPGPG